MLIENMDGRKKLRQGCFLLALMAIAGIQQLCAQPDGVEDIDYWNVVSGRARKIVSGMGLSAVQKAEKAGELIALQYYNLRSLHDERDGLVSETGRSVGINPARKERITGRIKRRTDRRIQRLHQEFIKDLSAVLDPGLIEMVKDGMTYGLLDHTYNAYLRLLPDLTELQKKKIREWLVEARETAMDSGSSEEKHACFRKYRGKINNYLSEEGYDLKQAERENAKSQATW
ncbi:MAG: DUF3826 domain-containing protein [Bacteroidales bacterium]|nr:DUF3826 domain-containing protein [Bacteroidales bacterium]